MFLNRPKLIRAYICVLLVLTCFLMAGCLRAEAHREFPQETTPESSAPVVDNRPRVALTFDDGPSSITTKPIVDELNKYGYHATFFVVGNRVDRTPNQDNGASAMVYAYENGNEIGIHAYTHNMSIRYDDCSDETYEYEVFNTLQAIQTKIPGYEVRVMRPIGGEISSARVAESPFAVVNWNIDSSDWELRSPAGDTDKINTIVENVLCDVADGDIILMHDIYNNTYEATVIILQRLNEMGFNVVTVSELLGDDLQQGRLYTKAP